MHFCPLHHIWLKVGQGRIFWAWRSNERALMGGMTIAWSLKEKNANKEGGVGGRLARSQMARLGARWWQLTYSPGNTKASFLLQKPHKLIGVCNQKQLSQVLLQFQFLMKTNVFLVGTKSGALPIGWKDLLKSDRFWSCISGTNCNKKFWNEGGGSKVVWTFSENSSIFPKTGVSYFWAKAPNEVWTPKEGSNPKEETTLKERWTLKEVSIPKEERIWK